MDRKYSTKSTSFASFTNNSGERVISPIIGYTNNFVKLDTSYYPKHRILKDLHLYSETVLEFDESEGAYVINSYAYFV